MHDGITFETDGIPAAVVILDVFRQLAFMKRRHFGCEEFEPVILPGYIGVPEVNRAKGEEAYPGVVQWLTEGTLAPKAGQPAAAAARPLATHG